jgi:hypothetical protein
LHWGNNLASLSPLSKALRKTRGGTPRNNSQTESSRAPRSTPSKKTKNTISHPSLFLQAAAPRADRAGFFHTPASLSTGLAASARSLGRLVIDRWCRERERREREREKRKRRGKAVLGERVSEREKKKLFSPQHLMKALLAAPARYSSSVLFSRRNTIFFPRASAFASMVDVPSAGAGGAGGGDRKRARRPRGGRGRTAGTGNGGGGIANGGLGGGAPGAALGLGGAPAHFSSAAVQAGKVGCSKRERDRGSGNSQACESVQSEIDLNG